MFTIDELKTMALQIDENPVLEVALEKRHRMGMIKFLDPETELERAYRLSREGNLLFDLRKVLQKTGLREDRYPRLAIAKAGVTITEFQRDMNLGFVYDSIILGKNPRTVARIAVGQKVFDDKYYSGVAAVPTVPEYITSRSTYDYVLWEPEEWSRLQPRDPILCQRLGGLVFVVTGAWDLTPLEAALFSFREETIRIRN